MPTEIQDLEKLLERVRATMGPDRELDAAIHRTLFPDDIASGGTGGGSAPVRRVTSSLDACASLMREVLPRWDILSLGHYEEVPYAMISGEGEALGYGHTLHLAWIDAIVRAVKRRQPPKQRGTP